MSHHFYIAEVIVNSSDPDLGPYFQTAVANHVTRPNSYADIDGRARSDLQPGFMLTYVWDATPAEHAACLADPKISHIPFDDAAGHPLGPGDPLSDVDAAKLQAIRNGFEARHIPTDLITPSMTIRQALGVVARRLLLRQTLKDLDWSEALGATVSSLPSGKRSAMGQKLSALGFDTSVISSEMTVRQSLVSLTAQNVKWLGETEWPL